jgi:hypothetical protein
MDGVALSGVSILMHDENHVSTVGMGGHTSHDESALFHDMPVNTLNINVSVRLIIDLYDSTVVPCNTPISKSGALDFLWKLSEISQFQIRLW